MERRAQPAPGSQTRQKEVLQIGQFAVKEVAAFCHFQQLMGTSEVSRPVVDRLRLDHLVAVGLDYHQRALAGGRCFSLSLIHI